MRLYARQASRLILKMEVPMSQNLNADFLGKPQLDYEAWRDSLQKVSARYNAEDIEPSAFTGWVRPIEAYGFKGVDLGSNAPRVERDHRDVRFDGADHYVVLLPLRGQHLMAQNERATRLGVGDVLLFDTARPLKFLTQHDGREPWRNLSLNLSRQELVAHLGFEPQGGLVRPGGTPAGRLLFELIQSANQDPASGSSSADSYMQLAVYDLVGALFAPSDRSSASRYADKLFARVRDIIKQGYADPDFGPAEVAARAGISLRYLHKLFTQHDSTCSKFIYSERLDHAAQLLRRRKSLRSGQPLSEIAYVCGFHDYTHFARKFRYRFGQPPGAYSVKAGWAGNATAHSDADERTLSA
jgi:AraC family transcriptional regulator, positive regulator of tynA and feaB